MTNPVDKQSYKKIAMHVSYVSIVINVMLSIGKFIAGIVGNSAAMVSDAVHSASDVFSTFIVMIGVKLSSKAPDATHQYGHDKLEYIAAIFLAFILALTGIGIGYEGLKIIISRNPAQLVTPSFLPLIAAVVSIVVKEWMFIYTRGAARQINSGALMADAWHHRSDALSSIGSFVGIGGALLGFPIMDSIASVIIAIMIIHASWKIFQDATNKLVDHACDSETIEAMKAHVLKQKGVLGIDDIRTRMFGSKYYVDIDITADGSLPLYQAHKIADEAHDTIERNFPDVKHCMVHVSPAQKV